MAAGIEPAAKITHSPPPQAAGQPERFSRTLRHWLLDRLESERYWPEPQLQTTRTLADQVQFDSDFMQVAELYRGYVGFDVHTLVAELVEAEAVPFLPVLRYKTTGLRKRDIWERTWELQHREDAIDADVAATLTRHLDESTEQFQARLTAAQRHRQQEDIGDISPPPKYTAADFHNATCWRLRGPLDVPKERFISYPGCSRAHDPTLVIAWAGWDHLQQARALAAWYTEMVEQEGWAVDRVTPLLAAVLPNSSRGSNSGIMTSTPITMNVWGTSSSFSCTASSNSVGSRAKTLSAGSQ